VAKEEEKSGTGTAQSKQVLSVDEVNRLFEENEGFIESVVHRLVRDEDNYEEVIGQVKTYLWLKLPEFDKSSCSIKGFLTVFARCAVLNAFKKPRRIRDQEREFLPGEADELGGPMPEFEEIVTRVAMQQEYLTEEELRVLRYKLSKGPGSERKTFGLSPHQVAKQIKNVRKKVVRIFEAPSIEP